MTIIKDSGERYDPNKHETLRINIKDRRTISQFTHELTSPLRTETHPEEDDGDIAGVEFPAAVHELGDTPNMQAVRVMELATAGALYNLDDARRLFDAATETMDDAQKDVLGQVWDTTCDARARLPHARSDIEVESTYSALSRIVDTHALKNSEDKRLATYLAAFGTGLTRKSPFGQMHAEQLDALLEDR